MMASSAADHGTTKAGGEPVGGDFQMETILALWFGGDHAVQRLQTGRCRVGVVVVPPAFRSKPGELASIGCALSIVDEPAVL